MVCLLLKIYIFAQIDHTGIEASESGVLIDSTVFVYLNLYVVWRNSPKHILVDGTVFQWDGSRRVTNL